MRVDRYRIYSLISSNDEVEWNRKLACGFGGILGWEESLHLFSHSLPFNWQLTVGSWRQIKHSSKTHPV